MTSFPLRRWLQSSPVKFIRANVGQSRCFRLKAKLPYVSEVIYRSAKQRLEIEMRNGSIHMKIFCGVQIVPSPHQERQDKE